MDAAQKAKLDDQNRLRMTIAQMINQKVAGSEDLEKVVGELAKTVDRLIDELATLNSRIRQLERQAGK